MDNFVEICGIKLKDIPLEQCEQCQTKWHIMPKDLQRHRYGFSRTCPVCGSKKPYSAYLVPEAYLKYVNKVDGNTAKAIMTIHE